MAIPLSTSLWIGLKNQNSKCFFFPSFVCFLYSNHVFSFNLQSHLFSNFCFSNVCIECVFCRIDFRTFVIADHKNAVGLEPSCYPRIANLFRGPRGSTHTIQTNIKPQSNCTFESFCGQRFLGIDCRFILRTVLR